MVGGARPGSSEQLPTEKKLLDLSHEIIFQRLVECAPDFLTLESVKSEWRPEATPRCNGG
jgi:hypothetical protein